MSVPVELEAGTRCQSMMRPFLCPVAMMGDVSDCQKPLARTRFN